MTIGFLLRGVLCGFAIVCLIGHPAVAAKKESYQVRFSTHPQPQPRYQGLVVEITREELGPDKGSKGLMAYDPADGTRSLAKARQMLDPVWRNIVVLPERVFARKDWDTPFVAIPLELRRKKWVAGKPEPTPYTDIYPAKLNGRMSYTDNPVWIGKRTGDKGMTLDLLDNKGAVLASFDGLIPDENGRTDGLFMLSDHTLGGWFLDELGNRVFGVMTRGGVFLSPPIARIEELTPPFKYHEPPYLVRAIPLDDSGNRYLPLRVDGTFPLDADRTKGYVRIPHPDKKRVDAWLKEYAAEDGGSYWGWCTVDLERETGPIWRSIEKKQAYTGPYFLAQMRDGRWMPYLLAETVVKYGGIHFMPDPLLPEPVATAEEAAEGVGPALHARLMHKLATAPEFNQRVSGSGNYVSASVLAEDNPQVQLRARALDAALSAGDMREAREIAESLGGDYLTRYYLSGGRDRGSFIPTSYVFWYQLAAQTRNPKLRAEAEAKAERLEAELKRNSTQALAAHEAQKQREQARIADFQNARKAWLLSGGGITLPSEQKPSDLDRSRAMRNYMQAFDRYSRGQQTWEPGRPAILDK